MYKRGALINQKEGKEKMRTQKAGKQATEEQKQEEKKFTYRPLGEATNNLPYWRLLARANSFSPIDVYLLPRKDSYGTVKDVWNKEVIASYDVSFEPVKGGLACLAFNVTGIERPRRTFDIFFDNISHIKTCSITKDKATVKYLILKPLDSFYRSMKDRTQGRINGIYEKNFMGLNK
jgi:hypothetical protein